MRDGQMEGGGRSSERKGGVIGGIECKGLVD